MQSYATTSSFELKRSFQVGMFNIDLYGQHDDFSIKDWVSDTAREIEHEREQRVDDLKERLSTYRADSEAVAQSLLSIYV